MKALYMWPKLTTLSIWEHAMISRKIMSKRWNLGYSVGVISIWDQILLSKCNRFHVILSFVWAQAGMPGFLLFF